ncbi:MAG: FAD/NAD(P)-binding protein [Rhodospirillaceae bacterium]
MHIGIIGGGFTGCLLAVHLLRRVPSGSAVTLIERSDTLGRGAAYGTDNPEHLLNVRAGNMSAFPQDPQHFHAWLAARTGSAPSSSDFVSRMRFGEYVGDVFQRAVAAAAGTHRVSLISGLATALHTEPQPGVTLEDGRRLGFDRIALCFGNLPPADAPGLTAPARASPHYIHDPWRTRELRAISTSDDVVIVGSGLTMADVVQSLAGQGHKGPIQVVSRHGLVPLRHEARNPYQMVQPMGSLRTVFRALRAEAGKAPARGAGWRDVVDALRPWTASIWQDMSQDDRRRFLRHIRPYWEVFRHRLAPAVADTLSGLQHKGQLVVSAGRVERIDWVDKRFEVKVRPRGTRHSISFAPKWVVNCTGPQSDYAQTSNPMVRSAVAAGVLRADPLQLGLDVTHDGAVIDANGRASTTIYALGPPTRGAFWEMVAVPDIRHECARMAEVLLGTNT